ncbi:MAG: RT0821/Lpp0805 family surface protein [Pseudobdellovibrionaceae bacterium]
MKIQLLSMLVVASLTLTACMEHMGTNQGIGTATGAVVGGLAGSQLGKGNGQLVAIGAGVLLGSLLGGELGAQLDEADKIKASQAQRQAYNAPVGETISWNNPDSGHSGTITPTNEGHSSNGRYCREYSQTIYVDGKQQTGVGQACQNPDGTWQIVN